MSKLALFFAAFAVKQSPSCNVVSESATHIALTFSAQDVDRLVNIAKDNSCSVALAVGENGIIFVVTEVVVYTPEDAANHLLTTEELAAQAAAEAEALALSLQEGGQ